MSAMALLIVTALSATVAAVMSVIAWRVAREEHKREDARISALAAEIHSQSDDDLEAIPPMAPRPAPRQADAGIPAEPPRRPAAIAAARPAWGSVAPVVQDLPLREALPVASSTHLFEPAQPPASAGFRFASVVGLGVLVVGTVAALLVLLTTGPRTAPVGPVSTAVSPQAAPDSRPLELVALGHEWVGDQLTVRGVVRNPASGAPPVDRLTAVVFVFNQGGGFVTSARAAVAPSGPGPGLESTFVVPIPNASTISRYRVSFRSDDRVVPHLDKRESADVARVQ